MRRPLFLDRDGVIDRDREPYITRAEEIDLLPTVGEALGTLCRSGFDLYVVSNQQGVAKGYIDPEELPRMSEQIQRLLEPYGASIRHFEYCVALASHDSPSRKPAPGMIFTLRDRFGLDLADSFLIGDRWSDIEAGARAGLRPLLVLTGKAKRGDAADWAYRPEATFDTLLDAARYVVDRSSMPGA